MAVDPFNQLKMMPVPGLVGLTPPRKPPGARAPDGFSVKVNGAESTIYVRQGDHVARLVLDKGEMRFLITSLARALAEMED